jgi:hypothetical protein
MTDAYQPAAWQVDSQVERTRATPANTVEEGYDIAFHTGQGHSGTVFVPRSRYTVENVAQLVQEQADRLDAVGSLRSGM